jgi:formylglycine-generating enzyme required for sulfatase activity
MIVVQGGSFDMGDNTKVGDSDETPLHCVVVRTFAIGACEVTSDEYDQFAKATNRELPNVGDWGRGRRPVINITWEDANAYAMWLSAQTGKRYRLPTEAEWEYAARAGTKTEYWWGDKLAKGNAKCDGCGSQWDDKQTAPVGSFKPNSFGLHDTAGNVWEWVEDCWHENYNGAPTDGRAWREENGGMCNLRVIRGGSWDLNPVNLRSSNRGWNTADIRYDLIGFRLAQDLN